MTSKVPPWQTLLPLELYTHIIKFVVSRGDLYRVCLVSKYFLRDGQRWLYRDNNIPIKLIPRFARTVTNVPRLADLVHGLTIHFPKYFSAMYNEAGEDIVDMMLKTLKNLKRLVIAGLTPWTLESLLRGCQFRLEIFKSNIHLLQGVVNVLACQRNISEWTYQSARPDAIVPVTFPPNFFPQLSVLSIPATMLAHVPICSWAISRLHLDLRDYGGDKETRLAEMLKHVGPTLISLSLARLTRPGHQHKVIPMIPLVALFAKATPKIQFLGISDDIAPTDEEVLTLQKSSWTALRDLRTFVWWVDDEDYHDYSNVDPPTGGEAIGSLALSSRFAKHLALSCPALQRFIFVSKDDDAGFTWSNGVRRSMVWRKEVDDYTAPGAWTWA